MVARFPMCFLTFSKNWSSSDETWLSAAGGRGSGMTGVKVGSIEGTSAAMGLWPNLGRLLLLVGMPGMARCTAGPKLSGMVGVAAAGGAFSLRGRFLFSLVALGGAKFPTGGIL